MKNYVLLGLLVVAVTCLLVVSNTRKVGELAIEVSNSGGAGGEQGIKVGHNSGHPFIIRPTNKFKRWVSGPVNEHSFVDNIPTDLPQELRGFWSEIKHYLEVEAETSTVATSSPGTRVISTEELNWKIENENPDGETLDQLRTQWASSMDNGLDPIERAIRISKRGLEWNQLQRVLGDEKKTEALLAWRYGPKGVMNSVQ